MTRPVGTAEIEIRPADGARERFRRELEEATEPATRGLRERIKGALNPVALGAAAGGAIGGAIGNAASNALGTLTSSVSGFLTQGIADASDLGETLSKVSAIFGDQAAASIDAFAKEAPQALALTRQEALATVSDFGALFKAQGASADQAAKYGQSLTTLATDLGSFNNASPAEAADALGAALRGEAEPLRRFNILINEAAVKEAAVREGLIKTVKDGLTPAQKAQATYAAIVEQSKDAQGDFERTSGGLANQQRILAAEFATVRGEVGEQLLPIVTDLTRYLVSDVLPAFRDLVKFLSDNKGTIEALAPIFLGVAAGLVAINAALALSPIGAAVLAVGALSAAFVLAYQNSEQFRDVVQASLAGAARAVLGSVELMLESVDQFAALSDVVFGTNFDAKVKAAKIVVDTLREQVNDAEARVNTRERVERRSRQTTTPIGQSAPRSPRAAEGRPTTVRLDPTSLRAVEGRRVEVSAGSVSKQQGIAARAAVVR